MAHLLDMIPLIVWRLPFFVAVSMFQSLCLIRELASRLERSLVIMDVAGVANPCFHPILSGIDSDFKPRILPIIQHLFTLRCLGKTIPEQGGPKNAVSEFPLCLCPQRLEPPVSSNGQISPDNRSFGISLILPSSKCLSRNPLCKKKQDFLQCHLIFSSLFVNSLPLQSLAGVMAPVWSLRALRALRSRLRPA